MVILTVLLCQGRPVQSSEEVSRPEKHGPARDQGAADATVPPESDLLIPSSILPYPQMTEDAGSLPAPGAARVLLSPRCADGKSTLRLLERVSGKVKETQVTGQVRALAWFDEHRYLQIRESGPASSLELVQAESGQGRVIDTLPLSSLPEWAQEAGASSCSLSRASHGLWVQQAPAVNQERRVSLALRQNDTRFEIRRYVRPSGEAQTGSTKPEPAIQMAGVDKSPGGQRLWQVVPSVSSQRTILLWRNRPGRIPALQVEVMLGGSKKANNVRPVTQASEQLAECRFGFEDRLLCHVRAGEDRGWLLTAEIVDERPEIRLRQLTFNGEAATYALSVDGKHVAYVGADGPEGALMVADIVTAARRQVTLSPENRSCEGARHPELAWPDADHLFAQGYCLAGYHRTAGTETVKFAPEPPTQTKPETKPETNPEAKVDQAVPMAASSRPPAPKSSRRSSSSEFWSPRF